MKNKGNVSFAVGHWVGQKIVGVKCKTDELTFVLSVTSFLPLFFPFPFLPVFSKGPLWIRAKLLFNILIAFCPLDKKMRSIKDSALSRSSCIEWRTQMAELCPNCTTSSYVKWTWAKAQNLSGGNKYNISINAFYIQLVRDF